jgi:hypothetical protein
MAGLAGGVEVKLIWPPGPPGVGWVEGGSVVGSFDGPPVGPVVGPPGGSLEVSPLGGVLGAVAGEVGAVEGPTCGAGEVVTPFVGLTPGATFDDGDVCPRCVVRPS